MTNVQEKFQQALAFHQKGQLAEAQNLYEAILKIQSRHFDALHLSGVLAYQTKNYQKAMGLLDKAIKINPNYAEAYFNRGNVFVELKEWDAALKNYARAIVLKPDYALAYSNQGNVLQELKQWDAALASHDQAITLKPDFVLAYYNRGNVLKELEQWDAALASYDQAIVLNRNFAEAYFSRGNVLKELKQWDAALANYNQAIALNSNYADAYSNRGVVFEELKQWDAALVNYDRAIALKPDYAEIYSNRGNILKELGALDASLASHDRAIALKPDYAEAYTNRGNTLQELGAWAAALASFDQAIALKPDLAEMHYNKSFALLLTGDLRQGWEKYEWRWQREASVKRIFPQPRWSGNESLAGKTILLHREQGLGDTIHFCRYVPMVAALGAKVILEVQKPLVNLLTGLNSVTQFIAEGNPLPPFDYYCPLLSLPLAFKTNLENIPASDRYLAATAGKVEQWQTRLGAKTKPRIGLVWSGSKTHKNDRNRSIALSDLIGRLPTGFQYISLQKEVNDADKQILQSHLEILHFGNELEDFTDTAALCELMDVVISVDTSVAHLSAALGRPSWILLPFIPDWRWLLNRDDSPWYPTVRLYRQEKAGEWHKVFERVKADLLQTG